VINFIDSPQNKKIKQAALLKQKKHRYDQGKFLLEGERYIKYAKAHQFDIISIYATENYWQDLSVKEKKLLDEGQDIYLLSKEAYLNISETENSQGLIAEVRMPVKLPIDEILSKLPRLILYLDRIQDPGNLGTIIRTADAAGVTTIFINKGSVDPYNAKTIRSTAGSILNMTIYFVDDDSSIIYQLKKHYKMIVTDLNAEHTYTDSNAYGQNNCLVIGNEANGVSDAVKGLADVKVIIPIYGKAESLNAAVAAGIMIYQIKSVENNK